MGDNNNNNKDPKKKTKHVKPVGQPVNLNSTTHGIFELKSRKKPKDNNA